VSCRFEKLFRCPVRIVIESSYFVEVQGLMILSTKLIRIGSALTEKLPTR
jgi:hypothetical protein